MDFDASPQHDDQAWHQVAIEFADYAAAEDTAVTHLRPALDRAEAAGSVASWWFVRKAPGWRLRYLARRHDGARHAVHQALDGLREIGHVTEWAETIYEAEVHAFGGPEAMSVAHHLFHRDSQHVLGNMRGRNQRRELTILLCSTLMRGAGQDWYEQGDVWARVAQHRRLPPEVPPERVRSLESDLRRLMTVDSGPTSPLVAPGGELSDLAAWSVAFDTAGVKLGELAHAGTLRRGLRAVLTHHVIFHWNRLGLPYNTQSILAHAAQAVVLDD